MDDTLAELLPLARLHAANDETADTWAHLDQAGVFGICSSEDAGGSGLGADEEALIAIGLGRSPASTPGPATHGAVPCAPTHLAGQPMADAYRRRHRIPVA